MKLPSIVITGSKQELIEIEPLLVMIGCDNPDQEWNDKIMNPDVNYFIDHIMTFGNNDYGYHYGIDKDKKIFKSTNTKGIINYIEKYNKP